VKSTDAIGKKITGVVQGWDWDKDGSKVYAVHGLRLEDGTFLALHAHSSDLCYVDTVKLKRRTNDGEV